jgi:hypothetical protein
VGGVLDAEVVGGGEDGVEGGMEVQERDHGGRAGDMELDVVFGLDMQMDLGDNVSHRMRR